MSLSEIIYKTSKEHSLLSAKLCSNKIQYTDDNQVFRELYKTFNNYSLELTISPKSSPILNKLSCGTCGATKLHGLNNQDIIMDKLLEKLINKFKINILGTTELYKDGEHLHTHSIISPMPENMQKKLKKYVKEYYELNNNYIVNLKQIEYPKKYLEYLTKEPYKSYHYYNHNKEYDIETIIEKMNEKEKLKQEEVLKDPMKFHLYDCEFKVCPICDWIKRSENVSRSDEKTNHFYSECV